MSNSNLTWLDWALIGFGLLMLLHMPAMLSMHQDAAKYDVIRDTMGVK